MMKKFFEFLSGLFIASVFIIVGDTDNIVGKVDCFPTIFSNTTDKDSIDKIDTSYSYVYDRFKVFNPNIDSLTVHKFIEVSHYFKVDTTEELLEWCVGQILLESGAKQYRDNGVLVESYAGAIGFTQIMPSTALGYLEKYIGSDGKDELMNLGATDFSFAYSDTLSKSNRKQLSKEWLSVETNNIILWGYIMRKYIHKRGDIKKALIAYNAGWGGLKYYLSLGKSVDSHKYIKGIRDKIYVANSRID